VAGFYSARSSIMPPLPWPTFAPPLSQLPPGGDRAFAVSDMNLNLNAGETLCIVGESGSGKSVTGYAASRLLPPSLRVSTGEVLFNGRNLLTLSERDMNSVRGAGIGMIFQEPMTALNPLLTCGRQIEETLEAKVGRRPANRARVFDILQEVGLHDPERTYNALPHELSGGQRQRVMIGMAIAMVPSVVIADEPTTALDVTTQAQILRLLKELQSRHGTGLIFITHDFGVVADIADRIIVMHRGAAVEQGSADDVLRHPRHEYTKRLLAAVPGRDYTSRLAFPAGKETILSVRGLRKHYGRGLAATKALDDVSFDVARGETVGIIGESGSGKSTLGRCLVRLVEADQGEILFEGKDVRTASTRALRTLRQNMQMVFQDPFSSLNPRRKVGSIIAEAAITKGKSRSEARAHVKELLGLVGLDQSAAGRFPRGFSGGQRQRIGLARALAMMPSLIVADEMVSALDVSVQAQILELMKKLKQELSLTLLFITHDLRVAAEICDRLIVMRHGKIVETGAVEQILVDPKHGYTKQLLSSVPGISKWNARNPQQDPHLAT